MMPPPHGRQWHFRVEFTPPSERRFRVATERLQHYDGTITLEETGSVIEGYLEYAPWRKDDLKALSRTRRLFNRWQREQTICWSEWKVKPSQQVSSHPGKRQRKTTRRSRNTRKKE